jgi:formylglycine-generating enzyme required for sulfatase activity
LQPKPIEELRNDVPEPLSKLVSRLLAKSPDDRPATPGEVAALLQPFCNGADLPQLQRRHPDPAGQAPAAEDTQASLASASVDTTSGVLEAPATAGSAKPGQQRRTVHVARWIVVAAGLILLTMGLFYVFSQGSGIAPSLAIAPFEVAEAKSHQEGWARHLGLPLEHTNSIGMKFRLIPPGEFLMGSTPEEIQEALKLVGTDGGISAERVESGAPLHRVHIKQPFYLSTHEVTQKEYEEVQGTNPSSANKGEHHPELPVETVSWNDAVDFCVKLSQREHLTPHYSSDGRTWMLEAGTGYRLPTEAEWEFACRAGTTTKYSTGDRDNDLAAAAWFGRHAASRTHLVGKLEPNPFGLHDMHGNVSEWCQDAWDPNYYHQFEKSAATDPQGPISTTTEQRATRGGSWIWGASNCRSSYRDHSDFISPQNVIGLRVVLPVEGARLTKSK